MASGGEAVLITGVTVVKSSGSSSTGKSATHTTKTTNNSKRQDTVEHILTDNGEGSFGNWGTINYVGKTLNVRLVEINSKNEAYTSDYEDAEDFESSTAANDSGGSSSSGSSQTGSSSKKGGDYRTADVAEEILAASTTTVTYAANLASPQHHVQAYTPPPVTIDLCPYTTDYIVPGSVRFSWMGSIYEDYDGVLVRDRTAVSVGYVAGQLDYSAGLARITDYVVGPASNPADFTLLSLWTIRQNWTTASIFMRTQASPIKPSGFVLTLSDAQGNAITATANTTGRIDGTHLRGAIDYESGVVELQFGDFVLDSSLTDAQKAEWWYSADDVGAVPGQAGKIWRPWPVDPTTLRYNSVAFFYLPLDADLLGIDPVRLPQDGRVTIFQPGLRAVVGHTATTSPATLSAGTTVDLGRVRLSRARVVGHDGLVIDNGYTVSLEAGTVRIEDVTGWSQPVTIEHRIEDMVVVSDVGIDGTLKFTRQLTHHYPVPGSYVSSALMAGDLRARVSLTFDQESWLAGLWSDTLEGNAAVGSYNDVLSPIEVTNAGAMTERWVLQFTNNTTFRIIGEHVGQIGTGNINSDTAPSNPISGDPYFTIRALGWGQGWVPGNVVRINTIGAIFTLDVIRTVQAGPEAGQDYRFALLTRGDVDRP